MNVVPSTLPIHFILSQGTLRKTKAVLSGKKEKKNHPDLKLEELCRVVKWSKGLTGSFSNLGCCSKLTMLLVKGSIFLKNRHFIIQERFNRLIYGIGTIIKCGTWQPINFRKSLVLEMKWFLSHLLVAGCDIGIRFSVRPSVCPSALTSGCLGGQKIWTFCHLSSHSWVHMGFIL